MPSLPWSEALEVGLRAMDDAHREFIELLARARSLDDRALEAAWQVLIDHTQAHFAQEEAWMRASGCPSLHAHSLQHRMILRVMRDGARSAAQGDITPVRLMTGELAMWFPEHARTLDAALATHLQQVGYDPASGTMRAPLEPGAGSRRGAAGSTSP